MECSRSLGLFWVVQTFIVCEGWDWGASGGQYHARDGRQTGLEETRGDIIHQGLLVVISSSVIRNIITS